MTPDDAATTDPADAPPTPAPRRLKTPPPRPRGAAAPRRRTAPRPVTRVDARALNAYYGDNHAIKGVDLDYAANQVTAMIGPSGCGKSTLLRCINRMHEEIPGARAEGEVMLDDLDIYGPRHRRRRRAPGDRHGLPEAQPVPDDVDLRQRGRRACGSTARAASTSASASSTRCAARACGTRSRTASASPASACRAASSSACASRARSPSSPR